MPSSRPHDAAAPRAIWLPLLLLALALGLRAVKSSDWGQNWLPNFSPWMALAFAGTALFPRPLAWWLPLAVLIGGDLLLHGTSLLADAGTMAVIYGCFAFAAIMGVRLRDRLGALGLLGGTVVGTLAFYALTNSLAWLTLPEYAKTFAGWLQAQTIGLPGFPPTWTFLRNSLISDAGFATLLILAYNTEATSRKVARPLSWNALANPAV